MAEMDKGALITTQNTVGDTKTKTKDPPRETSSPEAQVLFANSNDVVFARGKLAFNRQGNVRFRQLLKERAVGYQANRDKRARRSTAQAVIARVHSDGGRFLWAIGPLPKGGATKTTRWQTVSAPMLITKVKQALRDMALCLERKTQKEDKTANAPSPKPGPTSLDPMSSQGPLLSSMDGRNIPLSSPPMISLLSSSQTMRAPLLTGAELGELMNHRRRSMMIHNMYPLQSRLLSSSNERGLATSGREESFPAVPSIGPARTMRTPTIASEIEKVELKFVLLCQEQERRFQLRIQQEQETSGHDSRL